MYVIVRTLLFLAITIPALAMAMDISTYQQPMFSLEYTIVGTGAEIWINDIPVINHDAHGKTTSEKQVPESIIDGKNTLMIRSFPLEADGNKYKEDAYIDVMISVYEKDAPSSEGKPILQIRLNPANPEERLLDGTNEEYGETPKVFSHSEEQTVAGRQVAIKSPFPRWAWQDGQTIENTQENFNGLLEKYKEIWEALNAGDKEKVFGIYDPAAKEFATAYHYEKIASGHRLMDTGAFIGQEEWVLGNINTILGKVNFGLKIYANGKLAHIIDEDNDPSLITYLNTKVRLISTQKFSFYKNQNGDWIMIR